MAFKRYRTKGRSRQRYKRQRRELRKVGHKPGTSSCKTRVSSYISDNLNICELKVHELIQIEKDSTGADISKRERDIVNFRGVKFWVNFQSLELVNDIDVNIAIIMSKEEETPDHLNFLRDYGSNRWQAMDINNSYLMNSCAPINTDVYTVLMRKKFKLQPRPTSTNNSVFMHSAKLMKYYVKVNRQLRFDGLTTNPSEGRMFLCIWGDECSRSPGGVADTNEYTHQIEIINYFREPKA